MRAVDGTYRWFRAYAAPRCAADGSILRWYGTLEDIHERKLAEDEAEASRHRLAAVLESTGDCVLVVDHDWRIVYLNGNARTYLARTRPAGVGDDFWDLYAEYVGGVFDLNYREALRTGRPVRFEAYLEHADTWLDVNACPGGDGSRSSSATSRRRAAHATNS